MKTIRNAPDGTGTRLCGCVAVAAACLFAIGAGVLVGGEHPPAANPETRPQATKNKPILLNFKDASVDAVLDYLSDATGLVIVQETRVTGRITVTSRRPINTEEAIALIDTVLKEKGYAAVRVGRNLKIVPFSHASKENIPVHTGGDPEKIPIADKLVTQIIPIKYADATRLKSELSPLISSEATVSVNAASNSLILIDTQAHIRRIAEVIQALDRHMSGVTEVKVYPLTYADASSTASLITDLFKQEQQQSSRRRSGGPPFMRFFRGRGRDSSSRDGGGSTSPREQRVIASADTRTNTVVVSAPPDLLEVIGGIIKELDANPSEEQSVFIYPLKNAQAANLETVLNSIFSDTYTAGRTTGAAGSLGRGSSRFRSSNMTAAAQRVAAESGDLVGQVYVVADEDTNSLLVRAPSKHFDTVKEMLAELDREIPQVLIKVLIAEVIHDDQFDYGGEYSVLNLSASSTADITTDLGGTTDNQSGGLISTTINAGFSATYNALKRVGRVDVLSRPYILTSDNQEATITVGQEVPFVRNSRTTDTGQTVNTIEYEDVGIILTVTPQINPDGKVIMTVAPEISSITDTTVPISETANATVYSKRSAQTRVAILNGQTIVIGGLMEDRITDTERKVPMLGDIPLFGDLFKRIVKEKVKTELLIFLTPHVAKESRDLTDMSEDEKEGSKILDDVGGEGTFQDHMDGMQRGKNPGASAPEEDTGENSDAQP